jgi:hypothetical protein
MNKEHSEQVKGKCLRSREEQQVRKEVTQREGRSWEKLRRRRCRKRENDGEAWWSEYLHQVEAS